jgi:hypothetical protein
VRHRLFAIALIGALCAASGCATPEPAAIAIDRSAVPRDEANPASHSVASTFTPRLSSDNSVRTERYEVPPDFDSDVALHPYTSLTGPCPEGVLGARCANTILPSHYNR